MQVMFNPWVLAGEYGTAAEAQSSAMEIGFPNAIYGSDSHYNPGSAHISLHGCDKNCMHRAWMLTSFTGSSAQATTLDLPLNSSLRLRKALHA